jgi:hypothetical protein
MASDPSVKMDTEVYYGRISKWCRDQIKSRGLMGQVVVGRFRRAEVAYEGTLVRLTEELRTITMRLRHETELVAWVRGLETPDGATAWAAKFFKDFNTELQNATWHFKALDDPDAHPFQRFAIQQAKAEAFGHIVAKMVARIQEKPDHVNTRVLALWQYIVTPDGANYKWGRSDQIIFQPSKDICVMDLLVDALIDAGQALPALPVTSED